MEIKEYKQPTSQLVRKKWLQRIVTEIRKRKQAMEGVKTLYCFDITTFLWQVAWMNTSRPPPWICFCSQKPLPLNSTKHSAHWDEVTPH